MVLVTPTKSMAIRPGQYISGEGRVYHPYLAGWKEDVSEFFTAMLKRRILIKILIRVYVLLWKIVKGLGLIIRILAIKHDRISLHITRSLCQRATSRLSIG